jgi:hypothetical protein
MSSTTPVADTLNAGVSPCNLLNAQKPVFGAATGP